MTQYDDRLAIQNNITYILWPVGSTHSWIMEKDNYPTIPHTNRNTLSGNAFHNEIPFHEQERLKNKIV